MNPFFLAGKVDDYFMMDAYDILPGQRIDDTDNQTVLLSTIKKRYLSLKKEKKKNGPLSGRQLKNSTRC